MATKTISIGEDAYELLASQKQANESFTQVIKRIAGHRSLLELAGILSPKEAELMKQHIQERRKAMRERMNKTAEAFK